MKKPIGWLLLAIAVLTGVEGNNIRGDDYEERPRTGVHRLASNTAVASSLRLRMHLQDKIKNAEDSVKKMKEEAKHEGLKPAWAVPENPKEDRLNADQCKEPKPYVKTDYAGAFGPEKIFCCHTVRQVIEDVQYRCEVDCNDAHPCHKSMKEVYCPKYLAAYRQMEAVLCRTRPTTTTTTTTSTTTTTLPICLDGEHSPEYPCTCGKNGQVCDENEICNHADGTCSEAVPHCPNGTHSEIYPCKCGPKECEEGEVCTDWEKGICEHMSTTLNPLQWCFDKCEVTMKDKLKAGRVEAPEECESPVKQQQMMTEKRAGPACEEFCEHLHAMGALRPEDEHADHAVS